MSTTNGRTEQPFIAGFDLHTCASSIRVSPLMRAGKAVNRPGSVCRITTGNVCEAEKSRCIGLREY